MADEYPTPSATATPTIENPAPGGSNNGVQHVRARREPERTWKRQLELDYMTIRREVIRSIEAKAVGEKWLIKSTEEQRSFVGEQIEKELSRRERGKNTTTARADYPEMWEEECEKVVADWVHRLSKTRLPAPPVAGRSGSNFDQDRDDEEEDLPRAGIKREPQDDKYAQQSKKAARKRMFLPEYREPSEFESGEDDSENEDEGEEDATSCSTSEERGHQNSKSVKSVACTRGLGLIQGSSVLTGTDIKATNIPGVSKPSWVWKDGNLFVWPPIAGMPTNK